METDSVKNKKNTFTLLYAKAELKISGDFDSGNLNHACVDM
jgi:hypothetical protein